MCRDILVVSLLPQTGTLGRQLNVWLKDPMMSTQELTCSKHAINVELHARRKHASDSRKLDTFLNILPRLVYNKAEINNARTSTVHKYSIVREQDIRL